MVLFEKPTHADLRATTEVDEQIVARRPYGRILSQDL